MLIAWRIQGFDSRCEREVTGEGGFIARRDERAMRGRRRSVARGRGAVGGGVVAPHPAVGRGPRHDRHHAVAPDRERAVGDERPADGVDAAGVGGAEPGARGERVRGVDGYVGVARHPERAGVGRERPARALGVEVVGDAVRATPVLVDVDRVHRHGRGGRDLVRVELGRDAHAAEAALARGAAVAARAAVVGVGRERAAAARAARLPGAAGGRRADARAGLAALARGAARSAGAAVGAVGLQVRAVARGRRRGGGVGLRLRPGVGRRLHAGVLDGGRVGRGRGVGGGLLPPRVGRRLRDLDVAGAGVEREGGDEGEAGGGEGAEDVHGVAPVWDSKPLRWRNRGPEAANRRSDQPSGEG